MGFFFVFLFVCWCVGIIWALVSVNIFQLISLLKAGGCQLFTILIYWVGFTLLNRPNDLFYMAAVIIMQLATFWWLFQYFRFVFWKKVTW